MDTVSLVWSSTGGLLASVSLSALIDGGETMALAAAVLIGVEITFPSSAIDSHLGMPKTTADEKIFYKNDAILVRVKAQIYVHAACTHTTEIMPYLALNRPALFVGAREGQKLGGRFDFFPGKDQGFL